MADILHFTSQHAAAAKDNLEKFILMCRDDLTVFGADLDWHNWRWPSAGVYFTKLGQSGRAAHDINALDKDYIEFSKAYLRYQQGHKPTLVKNEQKAIRAIEAALLQIKRCGDIQLIDVAVLDEAALLAKNHFSDCAAYHCGRELMRLAIFVTEKQLVNADIGSWKSPIKKPGDITIQTGLKAKAIQDKKMPSEEAIDALAEIFATCPKSSQDIFTTSVFAMIMCAPSRISEILELPVDCEVEESDSKGVTRYGWRFFSAKGYEGDIKWIPTVMVDVAKESVKRIRDITEESRRLAKWIESNPTKPYRHAGCPDVLDETPLTAFQVCDYLGVPTTDRRRSALELGRRGLTFRDGFHTLSSLWKREMSRQPEGLPWLSKQKKIKYSNALFCMLFRQLVEHHKTSPLVLWAPDANSFNNDLKSIIASKIRSRKSIFDRYGYKAFDGTHLRLQSHQPRHLLNTIANRGGLTQDQIAKWSGRADSKQNRVYNHMGEFEMVAKAEALNTGLTLFGPKGEVIQHVPISSQDINLTERGAMHVTEFGICVHDYTMSPCEKFRDCLGCREQVCLKGDGERLNRIKMRLFQVEKDYAEAQGAISEGYSGADKWFEYHEKTVVRLRQLVEILESPEVPDGSQIKLRDGKDYSHLRRAVVARSVAALERNSSDAERSSGMVKMLGGDVG